MNSLINQATIIPFESLFNPFTGFDILILIWPLNRFVPFSW